VSEDNDPSSVGKSYRDNAAYLGLGIQIAASLVVFVLGGLWIDNHFGTLPLFVLIGVALGMTAMIVLLVRASAEANRDAAERKKSGSSHSESSDKLK
jgi:F0F1-type ATP synthase assembly protein I